MQSFYLLKSTSNFSQSIKPETEQSEIKSFNTKNKIITGSVDIEDICNDSVPKIMLKVESFQQKAHTGLCNTYFFGGGYLHI